LLCETTSGVSHRQTISSDDRGDPHQSPGSAELERRLQRAKLHRTRNDRAVARNVIHLPHAYWHHCEPPSATQSGELARRPLVRGPSFRHPVRLPALIRASDLTSQWNRTFASSAANRATRFVVPDSAAARTRATPATFGSATILPARSWAFSPPTSRVTFDASFSPSRCLFCRSRR
jgi:hypothetical protein